MMLHRRFLGILVGLTAVVAAFGQGAFSFKINEVVVSNTDGLIDEYGERTDGLRLPILHGEPTISVVVT